MTPKSVSPSTQRSFRLSWRTLELIDAAVATKAESRNALVERLLAEGIRLERHPLIRFRSGAYGRRRPYVVGTRLYIHQVISTLRASDGDVDETAEWFDISPHLVRAALEYYADFPDEVDDDAADALRVEQEERARWERQQRALA